jgi:hypothetical protein
MCLPPPSTPHLSTQFHLPRHSATYQGKPPVSSCLWKHILFYCRPTVHYFIIHLFSHVFAYLFIHSFIPSLINATTNGTNCVVRCTDDHCTALPLCVRLYQPQIPVTTGADRPYIYMQGIISRWNKQHSILCKSTMKLCHTTTSQPAPDITMHSSSHQ